MPAEPLLTAAEIAPLLRVSVATIYRWADDGSVPCVKIGKTIRFRRSEIERFLLAPASGDQAVNG